jgi:hypothetical protein
MAASDMKGIMRMTENLVSIHPALKALQNEVQADLVAQGFHPRYYTGESVAYMQRRWGAITEATEVVVRCDPQ